MKYSNKVSFTVWGKYALFSDPITRVGGEKSTYQLPTYQALKGVLDSIYWKPTFTWFVDRVRVMHPILTESKHIRPINYSKRGNTLSIYTYLREPKYQVEAHFEWNENLPEFAGDRNEHKHFQIAKRMIERGGRRDVFLGTKECQAFVEPCKFGDGNGHYDNTGEMRFGLMFHGFDYPSETGREMFSVRFWHPIMKNGCIDFLHPAECKRELCRDIRPMQIKTNYTGNEYSEDDDIYLQKIAEEVEAYELDSRTM